MVTRALHGTVEIDLAPEGLRWTLDMPASQVQRTIDEVLLNRDKKSSKK
jgi:hypothetical protein